MTRTVNDMEEKAKKLLGVIGLCRSAGKLIMGTPMVCDGLRDGKIKLVLEAFDTSENTHKKICDKCSFYGVRLVKIDADCLTLGSAIGKSAVACVGVTDENFVIAIESKL